MTTGHKTQVLVESGIDYRLLQNELDGEGYDYTARAGHDTFWLDGHKTPYEIIVHEKFTGHLSTFIAEHTEGMVRASPYERNA